MGGGKRLLQRIILSQARSQHFFYARLRSNEKAGQNDCTCFLERRGCWENEVF